ncbi:hypothetical protein BCR37DRAFT_257217 [Protomyces lactucae-debilis]|uniref:RNase P subunit Pop3-domain-containing protein n=1 Tax=Protomyces lactucae-debilis TaxID=2754530 RepID=A0A1Y2FN76_PROLT|nr:uncharacterized protein BCR37DRAFT_257217 [Protomyces lactucae-debilis]ORY85037.1 hypothetical protein BCR37DRAFT_257217 [Protomyces lactucae-debilis]
MTLEQSTVPPGRKTVFKTVLDTPFPPETGEWPKLKEDAKFDETSFYDALSKTLLRLLNPIDNFRRAVDASRAPKRRRGRQGRQLAKTLPPAPLASAEVSALSRCIAVGLNTLIDTLQLECTSAPLFNRKSLQKRDARTVFDIGQGRAKLKSKRKAELNETTEVSEVAEPLRLSVVLVCREALAAKSLASHLASLCSTTVARRVGDSHTDCPLYLVALPTAALVDLASALGFPRVTAIGLTADCPVDTAVDAQLKELLALLELNMKHVVAAESVPLPNKDNVTYVPTKLKHIETTAPIMKQKQGAKAQNQ